MSEQPPPDAGRLTPLEDLEQRRAEALAMGGEERIARHHASGRLTARERIARLVDTGSWYEIGLLAKPDLRRERPSPADAVVTGFGRINARKVAIIAVDATVLAGTTAPINMAKQNRVARWAAERGFPLICLSDNDGGRIPDVMGWRFSGLPFDFRTFLQAPAGRPTIPRLIAVVGESYGDSALHASMGHYVVMTRSSAIALSGPPVVLGAIGQEISPEDLGGPSVAAETNLYAHAIVDDDESALTALSRFLSYLPDSSDHPAPVFARAAPAGDPEDLVQLVPTDPKRGYDMRRVLDAIFDEGSIVQWAEIYGPSLICALGRLEGHVVGIVASQPMQRAGVLDAPSLRKEAAFIDLCDTFNIPLVFLQDVPGLLIGSEAERDGILAGYEGVVTRLARATVPKIAVVVRKAYGGGHFALGGRPTHPDVVLAWPTAELGFMAAATGVRTVYKRQLEEALEQGGEEAHAALMESYSEEWARESEPWEAAARIFIDDVIDPRSTRRAIADGIDYAWGTGARIASART